MPSCCCGKTRATELSGTLEIGSAVGMNGAAMSKRPGREGCMDLSEGARTAEGVNQPLVAGRLRAPRPAHQQRVELVKAVGNWRYYRPKPAK